jgi:hypothetical protein
MSQQQQYRQDRQQEPYHHRHRFDPAAFLTGLILLALAAAFLLDASGTWRIPPRESVPLAAGGLALAAVGAIVSGIVRSRRRPVAGSGPVPVPPAAAGGGDDRVDGQ